MWAGLTHEVLKLYRAGIEAQSPDDSPVLQTLPTPEPKDTGHTPKAVTATGGGLSASGGGLSASGGGLSASGGGLSASGGGLSASGEGLLSWTASQDVDLANYVVKIDADSHYKESDALQIAELAPGTLSLQIPAQFLPRGATITAKVYVVLSDNRQAGSNTVTFSVPV